MSGGRGPSISGPTALKPKPNKLFEQDFYPPKTGSNKKEPKQAEAEVVTSSSLVRLS